MVEDYCLTVWKCVCVYGELNSEHVNDDRNKQWYNQKKMHEPYFIILRPFKNLRYYKAKLWFDSQKENKPQRSRLAVRTYLSG